MYIYYNLVVGSVQTLAKGVDFMKKLISIILVFLMLLSVAVMPAFAENSVTPDPNNIFEDKFIQKFRNLINEQPDIYEYKELEYHYNEQGEIDWAFVCAEFFGYYEVSMVCAVACGRVWVPEGFNGPWYFVYDVDAEDFKLVFKADWNKYEGIREVVAKEEIGRPIGDANYNGKLDIMDATHIQLALAGLGKFDYYNDIYTAYVDGVYMNDENLKYVCDMDRDGERTILDATAIQLKLAGIE